MNKCLNCGKQVKNKYCNVSCQNKHQGSLRADKKYGEYKKFKVLCKHCEKEFEVEEREFLFPQKEKYYCSRSCANSRNWSEEDKLKKSVSLQKKQNNLYMITTKCKECGKEFEHKRYRKRIFCSRSCNTIFTNRTTDRCSRAGRKGVLTQRKNRRSKNEMYLYELCNEKWDNVLSNEPMFNGWDADIILLDYKVAILWNGKWHYEKITEKHSVKQVQNRDNIKTKEIIKMGYFPYIIKDMGKHNKKFVESEFQKLVSYIENI